MGRKTKSSGGGAWRPLAGYKPLTSQRAAREITSEFHRVTRELDIAKQTFDKQVKVKSASAQSITNAKADVARLNQKLEEIGGRERYQQASVLLTDKNKSSSKWVFSTLTKLGLRPKSGETRPKTLEIGAINTQLLSCPWLDVTSIDIESRGAQIIEQDFFELDVIPGKWDVLVNAMVINCVPTKELRGRMLVLFNLHLQLNGHLFLVLPMRCLSNSPYMSVKRFPNLLAAAGFEVVQQHQSPKIAFFCLAKRRQLTHRDLVSLERMYPVHSAAELAKRSQKAKKQLSMGGDMKNDFAVAFDATSLGRLLDVHGGVGANVAKKKKKTKGVESSKRQRSSGVEQDEENNDNHDDDDAGAIESDEQSKNSSDKDVGSKATASQKRRSPLPVKRRKTN